MSTGLIAKVWPEAKLKRRSGTLRRTEEISDFTVNWFNGNIEHFTVFTQAWDKLVDSNRGIDVVTKYPEFYKLANQIKEGLK